MTERLAGVDGTLFTRATNSRTGKGFTTVLSVPLESGLGSRE